MKMVFRIEGDYDEPEDKQTLKSILQISDVMSVVHDAKEKIRGRRKHCEISDEEDNFLEEVADILYSEGIEW